MVSENRLPNVEASDNSSHSDQHCIIQPKGNIESQNIPPLQTHVNPEQIRNNFQNGPSPEVLNNDLQTQPDTDEINKLKERILVEWIKVQNIEVSKRYSLPKIRNVNKNQSISKLSIVVKNIIDEKELDLTFLNQLIHASNVISTKLCNAEIKSPKRNVPKNVRGKNAFRK